jgi:F like protein
VTWRDRHRRHVAELEGQAVDLMLDQLQPILSTVATRFATVVADASDAEARANLDDLAQINVQWRAAVHDQVLPWFGGIYTAGAEAAVEQVLGLGIAVLQVDPELLNVAAADYLAGVANRFYPLGEAAWTTARDELLAGFAAGEGVEKLRARILDVTELTVGQAEALARTEVIAASNMGAQARVDMMGDAAPPYRQWLATMDARTRPTHMAADGQVVARGQLFQVGASHLRVPGDPSGPAAEVVNCRCTVLFTDTPDPLVVDGRQTGGVVDDVALAAATGPPQIDSTTGDPHVGSMIALIPSDPEAWVIDGGEPADAVHMTLAYLGDGDDIPDDVFDTLQTMVEDVASQMVPLPANVFGAATWNTTGDTPSMVLNIGGPGVQEAHDIAWMLVPRAARVAATAAGPGWMPPEQHQPWVAHLCLAYGDPARLNPGLAAAQFEGPITFDTLRLTRGSDAYDYPLTGSPEEEQAMDRIQMRAAITDAVDAAVARVQAANGGGPITINLTIPMTAADGDAPPDDGGCPPGQHPMPDGSCMPDEDMPGDTMDAEADVDDGPPAQPGEHLRAIMHRQGTSTGLRNTGRVFTNMTYRDAPFAYHVQVDSSAHGGQPRVVPVGIVTRVVQTDNGDYGFVRLDLDKPEAYDHARRAVAGFDRWVSIGADETMATTTLVWPAPGEVPDEDVMLEEVDPNEPVEETIPQPERIVIDGANVAELTGVSTPAQADAVLEPTQELVDMFEGNLTATVQELTDAGQLVAASALNGGQLAADTVVRVSPVGAFDLPNIRVRRGGIVYPAASVSEGGCGCGGTCGGCGHDVTADPTPDVLTAAAATITLPDLPPAAWFQEPLDVDIDGAFDITDEGRIYGLLAPYGTNHRAYARAGRRQEAPRGNIDYSRFMGKWALTAEGKVHAGPITMDCGHAPIHRANHQVAVEHYDNACSVIGAAAVGESDRLGGIWIAGAILPGTRPDQIARALACACSGDWQPHPDDPGRSELVACLLVPAPGFARAHATSSYRADALVASTIPVRYVTTAEEAAARRRAATVSSLATMVGRTPAARVRSALKG